MTSVTRDDVAEQLDAARRDVEQAKQAVGAAALDGDPDEPLHDLAAGRERVEALERALGELERREAEQARVETEAAASAARLRSYEWAAECAQRVERVLALQEELAAAE